MKRWFKIEIEYDGGNFHGWQTQPGKRTVQGDIEKAIETLTHTKVTVHGAGRTDAGVHAKGQVGSFCLTDCSLTPEKILSALNALTGEDITIHKIEEIPQPFYARKGIIAKIYRYSIDNNRYPSPLLRKTHFHVSKPLDLNKMKECEKYLLGTHDFTAFSASDSTDPNPIKTITECSVKSEKNEIFIDIKGTGFLKNMVRIIAGTLIYAGMCKIEPEKIAQILQSRSRALAGPTAPPHGLTLLKVIYE